MVANERYEPERMRAACQRALQIGSTSYRSVNAILKNGLDRSSVTSDARIRAQHFGLLQPWRGGDGVRRYLRRRNTDHHFGAPDCSNPGQELPNTALWTAIVVYSYVVNSMALGHC
jgi:hypothetical protein